MKKFNYKKRNFFSLSPHLLGLIFLVVGVFIMISPAFIESENSLLKSLSVGGASAVFGLMVVFSYSGTLIDFTEEKFQVYYAFCGFKTGAWKMLPEIQAVKVISTTSRMTSMSNGVNPSMTGKVTDYKIFLFASAPQPVLIFDYSDKDAAIANAKILASTLKASLDLKLTA